jgi:D-alanyl-D-alanine carboxypeptidase (penicillin-binding protein 5/6)
VTSRVTRAPRFGPPSARPLVAALVGALLVLGASPGALAQTPSPPPPTPVVQPGGQTSPSPFPSTLRTPAPSRRAPEIRAAAAVLADLDTGQVLFRLNPNERRPIASLTKIMTALLVLERTAPTDVVTVSAEAAQDPITGISGLGLGEGERIRVNELLYALLLQSANDAAEALGEHVSGSVDAFVEQMNARAKRLGLTRSRFASPNGLDDTGYASAADLVKLTLAAYRARGFASVVATRFHTVRSLDAEPRIVQNRNVLLWLYPGTIGVKTGFTSPAGFCLVAAAQREGERFVAVVLGEPGEPFSDAAALLNYAFESFERTSLVDAGDALGVVEVEGRTVTVSAGASLQGLVPVDEGIARRIVLNERIPYPPPRGEEIGVLEISAGGRVVGRVPVVVEELPPPPEPAPGSWLGRAFGAVVEATAAVFDALLG